MAELHALLRKLAEARIVAARNRRARLKFRACGERRRWGESAIV